MLCAHLAAAYFLEQVAFITVHLVLHATFATRFGILQETIGFFFPESLIEIAKVSS
jgi:hypothetical protein